MKTTISLPDEYHRKLRKMAIDHSSTMADLICEAIRDKFFHEKGVRPQAAKTPSPLSQLQGILDTSSSAKEMLNLKKLWRTPSS